MGFERMTVNVGNGRIFQYTGWKQPDETPSKMTTKFALTVTFKFFSRTDVTVFRRNEPEQFYVDPTTGYTYYNNKMVLIGYNAKQRSLIEHFTEEEKVFFLTRLTNDADRKIFLTFNQDERKKCLKMKDGKLRSLLTKEQEEFKKIDAQRKELTKAKKDHETNRKHRFL